MERALFSDLSCHVFLCLRFGFCGQGLGIPAPALNPQLAKKSVEKFNLIPARVQRSQQWIQQKAEHNNEGRREVRGDERSWDL